MNWLAHVLLSPPTAEFRLGNLLADLVRGEERARMPAEFLRGVACHKAIDAFTDSHPVVRQSRARIHGRHRRFSGVLVDIFYDYCLAQRWGDYVGESLRDFTAAFYAQAELAAPSLGLPSDASATLARIRQHDLLGQYQRIDGVQHSLRRISIYIAKKWQRDYSLASATQYLIAHETDFIDDFANFFPQLRQHIAAGFGPID
jgi:acyl carrier protein phosphodiesterase